MPNPKGVGTIHRGGRTKGSKGSRAISSDKAREYITKRVTAELEPIMNVAIEQAKAGDTTSRRDLLDRAYGRPRETMEISGRDGKPLIIRLDE